MSADVLDLECYRFECAVCSDFLAVDSVYVHVPSLDLFLEPVCCSDN